MSVATEEVVLEVFGFVACARVLGLLSSVSREWRRIVDTNASLWELACIDCWRSKYCGADRSSRSALRRSVEERRSVFIDASLFARQRWWFRFTAQAGDAWTEHDPFWQGHEARELKFHLEDDHKGVVKWCHQDEDHSASSSSCWRLEDTDEGTILRVKNDSFHSPFPGCKLSRHPTNWGFIFHSVWVVYTNFPMHKTTSDRATSDRVLKRTLKDWQWTEVDAYNRQGWQGHDQDDDDDDDDDD